MHLIGIHLTSLDATVTSCCQGERGAAERQHRGYWQISISAPFPAAS